MILIIHSFHHRSFLRQIKEKYAVSEYPGPGTEMRRVLADGYNTVDSCSLLKMFDLHFYINLFHIIFNVVLSKRLNI